MKLSEAIRLGTMSKPQCRRVMTHDGEATCAMGAALDAVGNLGNTDAHYAFAKQQWPIANIQVRHPAKENLRAKLMWVVIELNDDFDWTREQIADWVETIERAREEAAGVPVEREAEHAVAAMGAQAPK